MSLPPTNLSPGEVKRLERLSRTVKNRRGRRNPSKMPDRLARTSAFAPRRTHLSTDSTFTRIYEVPGYSVVEVQGRELGSQHRDAIYALFRLPNRKITLPNPDWRQGKFVPAFKSFYETKTTWRELIRATGRTDHVNNLLALLQTFREIQQVNVLIYEGRSLEELERVKAQHRSGVLPDNPGSASPLITELDWDGAQLDSAVRVRYGASVLHMIEKAHLVSINADVQFKLRSDYAKSFWPFIDSQPNHNYIDEDRLAHLAGRDLWGEGATSATRAQFRKECRQAFEDMLQAGGLSWYDEVVMGTGRTKTRRYKYGHCSPRQFELELTQAAI